MQDGPDRFTDVEQLRTVLLKLLAPSIQGRLVVLAGNVANSSAVEKFLTDAGASEVKHIGLATEATSPIHVRLAEIESRLANPSELVIRELTAADPMAQAIVYAGSFTAQATFGGRPVIGARSRLQFDAEGKDFQLQLLAPQLPSERRIFDLTDHDAAVEEVCEWIQQGPIAISGIPTGFIATGSSHTYLVRADRAVSETDKVSNLIKTIAQDCRSAVLSRFDEGTPCTFYGYVSSDWVVEFGPFETLVYWNRETWRVWVPGIMRPMLIDDLQLQAATSTVHEVATRLHDATGYVGAFCTDGVLQSQRYIVHEINPRTCAGFSLLSEMCGGFTPLALVDLALRTVSAEANERLYVPLENIASRLRVQVPLVWFFDTPLKSIQDEIRTDAHAHGEIADWVVGVRRYLASDAFLPVLDF